jgi:hypothetical protein
MYSTLHQEFMGYLLEVDMFDVMNGVGLRTQGDFPKDIQ